VPLRLERARVGRFPVEEPLDEEAFVLGIFKVRNLKPTIAHFKRCLLLRFPPLRFQIAKFPWTLTCRLCGEHCFLKAPPVINFKYCDGHAGLSDCAKESITYILMTIICDANRRPMDGCPCHLQEVSESTVAQIPSWPK
jgi:hypothetical protein